MPRADASGGGAVPAPGASADVAGVSARSGTRTNSIITKPAASTMMMPRMPQYVAPAIPMNNDQSSGERKLAARPVVA